MSCPAQSLKEGACIKGIVAVEVSNGRKARQRDLLLVHRSMRAQRLQSWNSRKGCFLHALVCSISAQLLRAPQATQSYEGAEKKDILITYPSEVLCQKIVNVPNLLLPLAFSHCISKQRWQGGENYMEFIKTFWVWNSGKWK